MLFLDGTPVPEEDGDDEDDDGDEDYEGGGGGGRARGGGRSAYVSPRAKRTNKNRIVWWVPWSACGISWCRHMSRQITTFTGSCVWEPGSRTCWCQQREGWRLFGKPVGAHVQDATRHSHR